jgi:hypothetical protein
MVITTNICVYWMLDYLEGGAHREVCWRGNITFQKRCEMVNKWPSPPPPEEIWFQSLLSTVPILTESILWFFPVLQSKSNLISCSWHNVSK